MPRIKLIRPDPRETELLGEIGRLQCQSGKSYRYLCMKAGIDYSTFMRHKKKPSQLRYGEIWRFCDTAKREAGL